MVYTTNVFTTRAESYSDIHPVWVETENVASVAGSFENIEIGSFGMMIIPEGTRIPGRGKYILRHGIIVQMESNPDGFVIKSGEMDEEGYGMTYKEAYSDFITSLKDRLNSLRPREKVLSERDKAVLTRLRKLLK